MLSPPPTLLLCEINFYKVIKMKPPEAPKAIPHSTSVCQFFSLAPCFIKVDRQWESMGIYHFLSWKQRSVSNLLIACQL